MILKRSLLIIATALGTTSFGQTPGFNVTSVFRHQPEAIASFIDNVLRQLPSEMIIELVATIQQESGHDLDDAQLYERLCAKIDPLRSYRDFIKIIKLIRFQKQLLGKQICALLGDIKTIQNCIEIGTPGTYTSTIRNRVKGTMYALLKKPKTTDILQAHSFKLSN